MVGEPMSHVPKVACKKVFLSTVQQSHGVTEKNHKTSVTIAGLRAEI